MAQRLKDLPESQDDYWQDAQIELTDENIAGSCKHEFDLINARNIQCKHCRMGLVLDHLDEFKDGHLYREGKLVI